MSSITKKTLKKGEPHRDSDLASLFVALLTELCTAEVSKVCLADPL